MDFRSEGWPVKRIDWILLGAIVLASSTWCAIASQRLGATFDEPFYLEAGLDYWHHGNFSELLSAGVMPLAAHLQTLPVFVAERASGRTFTIEHDLGEMLRLARPVTLLFWVLLLCSMMRLGGLLGGAWGGRAATLLVALEPNFLAHASLATTDIALAACFTAFVAQFLAARQHTSPWRIVVPAIWFGLAVTAKVSALALLPFGILAAMLREPANRAAYRRLLFDSAIVLVLGLIFAIVYCGTGGQTWLHGTLSSMRQDHWLRPLVAWLGSLTIFPNALYAIWFQLSHNATGQAVYLAGIASSRSLWFYLPLLLLIKLTIPLLAAAVLAIAIAPDRRKASLIAVASIAAVAILFRVQTGIRFLLPLLAIVIAWVGAQSSRVRWRPAFRFVVIAVPLWMAAESATVWPDALRYVNELWGGPTSGYRVVSDSNFDWGQGLPELERWRIDHDARMAVWYFGTDTRFPELLRYNPRSSGSDPAVLKGRMLAVSVSLLYGGYLETPDATQALIRRLRNVQPKARTSTFFIFDSGY